MAEGTELGKAYVQIIPSAKGIKKAVEDLLGDAPAQAGEAAGQTMGSRLAGAVKTAIAAAGIGAAFTKALTEGAALEQSLGGVETLFKDSADTIKQYAAEAYKTAGVSANSYMEQVTSFSASLLQSLDGDTEKAAEYANRALVDMSDNANKMGTDIGSIQWAYQGFAKANYTMLDNLKLGYGGTKEEMQRLIRDASKMTKVQKKLGVEVDASSLSFGNIVNAISVMQESMGIAGTTATEAATTISGSLASMKAAFSNVLGGLTLGQDIRPALNGLADTVTTFLFGNLLPAVGNILRGLPSAFGTFIRSAGPQIGETISQALGAVSPNLAGLWGSITAQMGGLMTSLQGTFSVLPSMLTALEPLLSGVLGIINASLPGIQTALDTLKAAVESAAPMIQSAMEAIGEFMQSHAQEVVSALLSIAVGFKVFSTLTTIAAKIAPVIKVIAGLITKIKAAGSVLGGIKVVIAALGGPVTLIIAAVAALTAGFLYLWNTCEPFKQFWLDLGANIASFVSGAVQAVVNFFTVTLPASVSNAIAFLQGIPAKIAQFFQQLPYNIGFFLGQALGNLASWAVQLPDMAMQAASSFLTNTVTFFSQLPANLTLWLTTALTNIAQWAVQLGQKGLEAAQTLVTNVVTTVRQLPGKLLTIGKQAIEGLWNGILAAKAWLIDKIGSFVSGIVDGFISAFKIGSPSRVMRDKVGRWITPGIAEGILGNISGLKDAMAKVKSTVVGQMDGLQTRLSNALFIDPLMPDASGDTGRSFVQKIYFEQPMQAPDEIARTLRIQNTYGLAGAR